MVFINKKEEQTNNHTNVNYVITREFANKTLKEIIVEKIKNM